MFLQQIQISAGWDPGWPVVHLTGYALLASENALSGRQRGLLKLCLSHQAGSSAG